MDEYHFEEFPEISTKQWKQQIQFDLQGLDYNKTLIWNSPEGIDVKPFYNKDDSTSFQSHIQKSKNHKWLIIETIYVSDVSRSNANALDKIERGADGITFIIPDEKVDFTSLLKGLDTSISKIHIECEFLSASFVQKIVTENKNILVNTDIIGHLGRTGNWYSNLSDDHAELDKIIQLTNSITVDTILYQNAGALIHQQLAYGLSHLNEYLDHIHSKKLVEGTINVIVNIAVGSNYFFEISKIRALRILVEKLSEIYDFDIDLKIKAVPSKRNKTLFDYNTNMIRTTTECMSAILGGADYIENLPYDAIYHKTNEFGDRIARNQLLILRNESGFDDTSHYAEGSYYIETLTQQFAEKALVIFKEIEKNGGFLSQLKSNKIQSKIQESADKEQQRFDIGEKKLVGTNYVINKNDRMNGELQLYPFLKKNPRKTLIQPILTRRLAEKIEQERLESEN